MLEKLRQLVARFESIDLQLATAEIASDPRRSRDLMRERGHLQRIVEVFRDYERVVRDRAGAEQMLLAGGDPELHALARQEQKELAQRQIELEDELRRLLVDDDENSGKDIIVEIRAGVGGDEASLFVADLFRMYSKFAEHHSLRIEVLASSPSEVGGLKEVIFSVSGERVWDRLRYESGGHRVQRVPQTETQGRIHTSLATVAVLPEAQETEVAVRDEDVRVDIFRSGGPGGQNVNKVSSAVRLTHLPTGLVVVCQDESSQHKNRAKAQRVLRARLYDLEDRKRREQRDAARRGMVGSGDRSERIRTYNVPQNRVTDHRLKENYLFERVIEGDLDPMLEMLKRRDIDEKVAALE
jgi:peptide chain release factor 1